MLTNRYLQRAFVAVAATVGFLAIAPMTAHATPARAATRASIPTPADHSPRDCYAWVQAPYVGGDGSVHGNDGVGCTVRPFPQSIKVFNELYYNGAPVNTTSLQCDYTDWCQPPTTSAGYRSGNWCTVLWAIDWPFNDVYQGKQCSWL